MHCYITICSKEKKKSKNLLPAIERYLDPRIKHVKYLSEVDDKVFMILSGKYGLLSSDEDIPYYDELLLQEHVDALVKKILKDTDLTNIKKITVYGEDRNKDPNWLPYYRALKKIARIINADYHEEVLITPRIIALIGDFAAGKTSVLKKHFSGENSFVAGDIFGYLHTEDFKKFDLSKDKSKAFRLNQYRDLLIINSNKRHVICDEDILELLAYEFSMYVTEDTNLFNQLLENLKEYRTKCTWSYPVAYIDLIVNREIQVNRFKNRGIKERCTPEYFTRLLTQLSYRIFYNAVLNKIPDDLKFSINTSEIPIKKVTSMCDSFIAGTQFKDYFLIDTLEIIATLNLEKLKKKVLEEYERTSTL